MPGSSMSGMPPALLQIDFDLCRQKVRFNPSYGFEK